MNEHRCGFRDCAICGEMAELLGTETQIAAANEIRGERIERMVKGIAQLDAQTGGSERIRERRRQTSAWMREALRAARQQSDAAWWLDNRHLTIEQLREALAGTDPRSRL